MPGKVLDMERPKVVPFKPSKSKCSKCGGRGWHTHQFYAGGNKTLQEVVVICDCMKGQRYNKK